MNYGGRGVWFAFLLAQHGGGTMLSPHIFSSRQPRRGFTCAGAAPGWTLGGSAVSHPPQAGSGNVGSEVGMGAHHGAPASAQGGSFGRWLVVGAVGHSPLGVIVARDEWSVGGRRR